MQAMNGPSRQLAGMLGPVNLHARDLARRMDRDKSADVITEGLMDVVFPDRQQDEGFREMLRRNAYDNIDTVWRIIAGQDDLEASAPFGALTFSDTAAEIGVPLHQFQRIYRVGVGLAWSLWFEAAVDYSRDHGVDLAELLGGPSMIIHAFSDGQMTSLVTRYEATQAQDRRTREQLQLSILRQALDGTAVLSEAETEEALGIRLAGDHLAIAILSDRSPMESGLASHLRREVERAQVLEYRHGVRLWLLWLSCPGRLSKQRVQAVRKLLERTGVRSALGEPASGQAGLGGTGRDALDAARLQDMLGDEAPAVVSFDELRLESLLIGDPDRARRFVCDELGELDRDDARTATLRETARIG